MNSMTDHPPCQDSDSNKIINDINDLKQKGNDLLNNIDNPPSPSAKDAFNKAIKIADDMIQKILLLPTCDIFFCPQGTYINGKGCICPTQYPFPILGDDNKTTYCYNMSCYDTKNGKFIPSNSSDPSKNSCICNNGYSHDLSRPSDGYCYNNSNTQQLNTFTNQINNDINLLQPYLSIPSPSPKLENGKKCNNDSNCQSNSCIGTNSSDTVCMPNYPSCDNNNQCDNFIYGGNSYNGICYGGYNNKKVCIPE
jgi:hypothetical protein